MSQWTAVKREQQNITKTKHNLECHIKREQSMKRGKTCRDVSVKKTKTNKQQQLTFETVKLYVFEHGFLKYQPNESLKISSTSYSRRQLASSS
jgi:hypothetical protein